MDALAKGFRVLDFSGLDDEPPARVQSVENDDHLSMVFLPFKGGDLQPLELVPDLSAGTAGSAIPVSTPPPQRRGSKFVCGGYEVPFGHEEELLTALRSLRRPKGAGRGFTPHGLAPAHRVAGRFGCAGLGALRLRPIRVRLTTPA
jgi:hypothetical protein